MTAAFFLMLAVVAAFGGGYALGYNVAKNPAKVQAQASAVVAEVKKL